MSNIYKQQVAYDVPRSQASLARPMALNPTADERLLMQGFKTAEALATMATKEYVDMKNTEVADSLNQFKSDLAQEKIRYSEENKGKNALDAEQHFADYARQKAQEYGRDFEGQFKDNFIRDAAATSLNFADQGAAYASQQKQAWKQSVLQGDISSFELSIANNFKDVDYVNHQTAAIKQRIQDENLGMDVSAQLANIDKVAGATQIDGYLSEDNINGAWNAFYRVEKSLGEDAFSYRSKIKNAAEALQRRAEANLNRSIREIMKGYADAEYAAQYQGNLAPMQAIKDRLSAIGASTEAFQVGGTIDVYKSASNTRDFAVNADLKELSAQVSTLTNELEANAKTMTMQEHKELTAQLTVANSILKTRVSALNADPAAAADKSPQIAYPDNATPEDISRSRIEFQKNNYVPEAKRRVLTKQEAAELSSKWSSTPPEQKASLLLGEGGIVSTYGEFAPQVMKEMGVSPMEQDMVNRTKYDPASLANAKQYIKVRSMDSKDLPKTPPGTIKASELLPDSEVYNNYLSLARTTGSPEFIAAAKEMEQVATKMLQLGYDEDRIIEVMDSGVQVLNDSNYNIITHDPNVDLGELEDVLYSTAKERLPEFMGTIFQNEYERDDSVNRLLSIGVWTNSPDGKGYTLIDPVTGSPVINAQGEYFTYIP